MKYLHESGASLCAEGVLGDLALELDLRLAKLGFSKCAPEPEPEPAPKKKRASRKKKSE
jgi:hypothetical protein